MAQKKKLIAAAAFSFALAGGGVAGALIGTPGTSGAQQAEVTTTTAAPDAPAAPAVARPRPVLEAAAAAIGISVDDLKAAVKGGQTIAQVAQANNVDPNTVIDAMVTQATTQIRDRITKVVNGEAPKHRRAAAMRARRQQRRANRTTTTTTP